MKKMIKIIAVLVVFVSLVGAVKFLFFKKEPIDFSGTKLINIEDGGFRYALMAEAVTVDELFQEKKVELRDEDRIFPGKQEKIFPGMTVKIERGKMVEIKADGDKVKKYVFARTIEEAIDEAGVDLSHLDKVSPKRHKLVEDDQEIKIDRINIERVEESEVVEFETIEKNDDKVKWKKKKVKQEGKNGARKVVYEVTYENGKEIEREKVSSEVTQETVPEIIVVGTKIEVGKVQKGRASWYACFDIMAAASTTFPRGTWLRVTAVNSGKQIIVVVNDYGPSPETGKILDLDKVAFAKLAPLGAGVIDVKIEEIK